MWLDSFTFMVFWGNTVQCWLRDAYHYVFFDIDTDTDITFWYRYQIDPYRRITHNLIALREAILSWKAETYNQEHRPPLTTTACEVMMPSGYNNGDLHVACQRSVPSRNVPILSCLLEYTGLLGLVETHFRILLSIWISFWVRHFDTLYQ